MQMASAYCSNRLSLLLGPLALAGVVLLRLALGLGTQADWSGLLRYGPAVATVALVLMVFMKKKRSEPCRIRIIRRNGRGRRRPR